MKRGPALALAAAAFAAIAFSATGDIATDADPPAQRLEHQRTRQAAEVRARFEQAVVLLHAKQYEHAATALHRVLELAPALPEAHVNMGYALIGLGRHRAARDFFASALELRPTQANAYFGLALAEEGNGDLAVARGAMRSFLHLSRADDPHRAKARAALWEWEAAPGRGAVAADVRVQHTGADHGR